MIQTSMSSDDFKKMIARRCEQMTIEGVSVPKLSEAVTGGTSANTSGKAIEQSVANFLRDQGHRVFEQQHLGHNIYGGGLITDIYLPDLPLAIEIKWQDVRGSVDRIYPYLVENIRHAYPCPVVVVADGNGASPGALAWLKAQVDSRHLLGVYSLSQFYSYTLRGLGR